MNPRHLSAFFFFYGKKKRKKKKETGFGLVGARRSMAVCMPGLGGLRDENGEGRKGKREKGKGRG